MSCNCDEYSAKLSTILSLLQSHIERDIKNDERLKVLEKKVADIEALLKEPIQVDITNAIKQALGL